MVENQRLQQEKEDLESVASRQANDNNSSQRRLSELHSTNEILKENLLDKEHLLSQKDSEISRLENQNIDFVCRLKVF